MAGQQFQYDDSGNTFFYFLTSFVGLIVIPATYYLWPRDQHAGESAALPRGPACASARRHGRPHPLRPPSAPRSRGRAGPGRAVPPAGPSAAPLRSAWGASAGPVGSTAERDPGGCRCWRGGGRAAGSRFSRCQPCSGTRGQAANGRVRARLPESALCSAPLLLQSHCCAGV